MFRKGIAAVLAAAIVSLSPGLGAYRALAAVRVQVRVPVTSIPAGAQAGAAPTRHNLPKISLGSLSLGLNSTLTTVIPNPTAARTRPVSAQAAAVLTPHRALLKTAPPAAANKRSILKSFLSQGGAIRKTAAQVGKMPAHGAKMAGVAMMDKILGLRTQHHDGGDVRPLGDDFEFEHKNPLREPVDDGGDGGKNKPPPSPKPGPGGEALSPTTAAGQLTAGAIFGALAAAGIYGSKYLAAMSLAGALAYAPLAATILGYGLAAGAAGFIFLGIRIVLNRSGHVEAGDTAPMSRPYTYFEKGGIRNVLNRPVQAGRTVYIPGYAAWTLKLHAKVRAKAGRTIAYAVQAGGNARLLVGEAAAVLRSIAALIPLIKTMYRGDDEVRPFVKAHKKPMRTLQGINIFQAVIGVGGSYVVGGMVDAAIASTTGLFSLFLGGLVAIALANVLLNTTYAWIKDKVTANVLTDFRVNLFGHILKMPFGFFQREKPSEISARIAVDVAQLATKNIGIPVVIPYYGAMALFSGVMMAITSVQITLLIAALVPFFAFISTIYGNKAEKLNEAQFDRRAEMISAGEETLNQVRDIRAFSTEEVERKRFLGKVDSFQGTVMRKVRIAAAYNGGMGQFYQFTFYILVLGIGLISFMMTGSPTVGETMALVGYAAFMRQALNGSLSLYTQYRETSGAARRVMTYLKEKPAMSETGDTVDPGRLEGAVEFKNVTFSYDGLHPVLKNLSFKVAAGQRVALVGGTGSGKSALLDLIGHLDNPDSGKIAFDGKDTGGLKLSSLRRQMSLLHDKGIWIDVLSVRDNLTYGLTRVVSDQEIANALVAAGADFVLDEIMFPKGLDTVLSQGDWRLSDMRKKLFEIARAHIADPRILLLDRPAGGLNHFEASRVLTRLAALKRDRTTFSVTGRTDEAESADVILVLKDGGIVEQGTHAELLELGGVYYKLIEAEKAKDETED